MQYFGTNLTIYDEIEAGNPDLQDKVYDEYAERTDEIMNELEGEIGKYGIDFFDYSGKEEEDMNIAIGIEDGKDPEIAKKFQSLINAKLVAVVRTLESEFNVKIDVGGWDWDNDEDGFLADMYDDMDESKKAKKGDKDKELNEAELSAVKNSIATLAKKYIAGSFFDKLVATTGISQAKDILLGDLKNMVGRGTSAPAAAKFAQAIKFAKSTTAVDTILANYMLAGDGMKSGIGYNESVQPTDHIEAFRKYLAESRKAELDEKCKGCDKKDDKKDDKKKPSEKEIEEAIKIIESTGQKVIRPAEKIDEKKGCCGDKKIQKKPIKEAATELVIVDCGGTKADPEGVKELIDDAIATGTMGSAADAIDDIVVDGGKILIYTDDPSVEFFDEVRDGVARFLRNAAGIEAEVGEDTVDDWQLAFENSRNWQLAFENSRKRISDLV